MKRPLAILCLVLVTALAAYFRLHRLGEVPPGLFIDEAQEGIDARTIEKGERLPIFIEGPGGIQGRGREPMFHYLVAGSFAVLGPSARTLRLTSALLGTATVAAFFVLATRAFGLRAGFLAGLFLACSRWHVTFSRIGLRDILDPLWIVLALLACERLARRPSTRAAAIAGAVVGLGFYTYYAFWIAPPTLALLLLVGEGGFTAPELARRRPLYWSFAGAFALVTLPLFVYIALKPHQFFARALEISYPGRAFVGETFSIRDNVLKVLLMLHFRGDREPRHNIPGWPELDPVMGILFLVGLYWTLRTWRENTRAKAATLLFWLVPLVPSALTEAAPQSMRALGAAPAVALLSGLGLATLVELGNRGVALRRLRLPAAAAALLVSLSVWRNHHDYFERWGEDPQVALNFSAGILPFFDYLAGIAARNDVRSCPYVYYSPNIRFLALARDLPMRPIEDESAFTATPGDSRDRVFVCESEEVNQVIERLYPRAEVIGRYAVYAAKSGRIYRVPQAALRPSLDETERRQAAHFVARTQSAFRAQSAKW